MRNFPQELEKQSLILSEWMQNRRSVAAKIWRYRLTHGIFGMVLQDVDSNDCLYVMWISSHVLETQITWQNAKLELSLSNPQEGIITLRDANAGFIAECRNLIFSTERPEFFDYADDAANRGGTRAESQIEVDPSLFDEARHRHIDLDSRRCTPQELNAFLTTRWSELGAMRAEFWSYRAHSQVLDIRFQSLDSASNLHIACAGCHSWKTKMWWPRGDVKVQLCRAENSCYSLQEAAAGWSIECDVILLTANVKPQFDPSRGRRQKALREEQRKASEAVEP